MIDIHSHILWGVDDGARDLEESLELIEAAARAGTTDIVATPHASPDYEFQPLLIDERLAELRARPEVSIRIHRGCDFHLSRDNIEDAVRNPAKYTIAGGRYLLVEFSDLVIFQSSERDLERLRDAGMVPVITHPERNPLLRQRLRLLQRWVDQGCLMQITADSYLGRFGRKAKSFAEESTRLGLVHFAASDGHHPRARPARLDGAYRHLSQRYSEALARRLCVENPRAVLEGDSLPESAPVPERNWIAKLLGR
jgi:protein-tyrosine phosphatase